MPHLLSLESLAALDPLRIGEVPIQGEGHVAGAVIDGVVE
jgi:hypothetical protein